MIFPQLAAMERRSNVLIADQNFKFRIADSALRFQVTNLDLKFWTVDPNLKFRIADLDLRLWTADPDLKFRLADPDLKFCESGFEFKVSYRESG